MDLAAFSAISNGKYNLGSVRLEGEGDQQSLVKVNNHRWLANKVADDPAANARVREALSAAIRREAGIPQEIIERLVENITSAENINRPLERREIKSVLQQIGETRLKEQGVFAKFRNDPKLNTAIALTANACIPENAKGQEISKMIVSSAITAYNKGNLKLDKNFVTEARVQVFHTMFKNVQLRDDMPTEQELREMKSEEFFQKCTDIYGRITTRLNEHTADVLFPENSLFAKYRGNEDWDSDNMQGEQMMLGGQMGGVFTPGDLTTLKSNVKEFSLQNLPSVKVMMESRVGGWLDDFSKMSEEAANDKAEEKIGKDVTSSRIKGEFRFSLDNDDEFVTIAHGDTVSNGQRGWIASRIDDKANTRHQAAAIKLLLCQESLQPFRELMYVLGIRDYDEHTGFNYYLNENEDGSFNLDIKKDFTEYGDRNISASFSWRIETDGTATMEDFKVKLPR